MFDSAMKDNNQKAIDIVKSTCSNSSGVRKTAFGILESMMFQHDQVEIPVNHRFHGDMYLREITLKKDTLLTGRIHKFDHFDIMLSGKIIVSTDDGQVKEMSGLNIMKGKAGKKRAGYVLEDTHWITIHSAQEQEPENMVEFLTVETFEELHEFNEHLALALKQINDHKEMIGYKEDLCQ